MLLTLVVEHQVKIVISKANEILKNGYLEAMDINVLKLLFKKISKSKVKLKV